MLSLDETKLERRSLARSEFLFRQGDKVQAIYFIEEGRLRLDRRTFDGRSLVFGTNSAGEFFVEAALFADIFHCDAVATEPSRVRIYPKTAVLKALNTEPSGALWFLKLMAHQVIEARQRLDEDPLRKRARDALSRSPRWAARLADAKERASGHRQRTGSYARGVLSHARKSRTCGCHRAFGSPHHTQENLRHIIIGAA
jgi:CRP-like cAMP-binding protein